MQIKYGSRGSGSTCSSKTTLKASLDNNLKSQILRVYLASRGESRQIPKKANKAASFNHVTDVPLICKNKFRCMKKQKQLHFPKIMSKFKPHHNCKSSPKKIFIKLVMQVGCKTCLHGLLTEDESGLDPKEAEKQT